MGAHGFALCVGLTEIKHEIAAGGQVIRTGQVCKVGRYSEGGDEWAWSLDSTAVDQLGRSERQTESTLNVALCVSHNSSPVA